MADGRILHSGDRGETWEETGVRIGSNQAMAAAGEIDCPGRGGE
jgi:hypothetical protein